MATLDQQFIEFIVKTLVNNPDEVKVEREIDERGVLLSLTVAPEDIGRIIGRHGATAQSLRTLLRVLGTKSGARYNLKIINTDGEETDYRHGGETSAPAEASEAPAPQAEAVVEEESVAEEDAPSDLAEKTRAELADLDDLDI